MGNIARCEQQNHVEIAQIQTTHLMLDRTVGRRWRNECLSFNCIRFARSANFGNKSESLVDLTVSLQFVFSNTVLDDAPSHSHFLDVSKHVARSITLEP